MKQVSNGFSPFLCQNTQVRILISGKRQMLYNDCKNIYIGKLIKERVDELQIPYSKFARMIHCSRAGLYRIFENKSIDIERLVYISHVLEYDFIREVYLRDQKDDTPHSSIVIPLVNGQPFINDLPAALRESLRNMLCKDASKPSV